MVQEGNGATQASHGSATRLHPRAWIYLALVFVVVLFTTCEMKTGMSFDAHGHDEGPVRIHEPWTWRQVGQEMGGEIGRRIVLVTMFIIPFEAGFQLGRRDRRKDGAD